MLYPPKFYKRFLKRGVGKNSSPKEFFPDKAPTGFPRQYSDRIFCSILCEFVLIGLCSVFMELIEVLVLFEGRILSAAGEQVNCDIGAVVGYSLDIGKNVDEVYADLDLADSALCSADMNCFKLLNDTVNDLLQRLDFDHIAYLHCFSCFYRKRDYLVYGCKDDVQLLHRLIGEGDFGIEQRLGCLKDIDRIVAYPLKLGDKVEICGNTAGFVLIESAVVELDKVLSDSVLKSVHSVLTLSDNISELGVEIVNIFV